MGLQLTYASSWKEVYAQLNAGIDIERSSKLYRFLSSENALRMVSDPTNPFPRPTPESKASFETKTAAINITPSSRGQYNLGEIRDDASWLSKQAEIDEESSLRTVVLEWQCRPATQLQWGFSEAEKATVTEAFGPQNVTLAVKDNSTLEHLLDTENDPQSFLSTENRRIRLLRIYLAERCSILAITRHLLSVAHAGSQPEKETDLNTGDNMNGKQSVGAAEELGNRILHRQAKLFPQNPHEKVLMTYVTAVREGIDRIERGCGWLSETSLSSDAEIAWLGTILTEMVTVMELIFLHLRAFLTIPSAPLVLEWLGLMAEHTFFEQVELGSAAQASVLDALKSLAPIITLAILNVNDSIQYLLQSPRRSFEENESNQNYYFLDRDNIDQIHRIFLDAAASHSRTASVPILAWGLLCYTLRDAASEQREAREKLPSETARRRHSGVNSGSLHQSLYDDISEHLRHISGGTNYPEYLFHCATEETGVFEIIHLLARSSHPEEPLGNRWKRQCLQELISLAFETAGYSETILLALFSTLEEPVSFQDSQSSFPSLQQFDLRAIFLQDQFLMGCVFDLALKRFPHEATSFLRLCKLLASSEIMGDSGAPFIVERLGFANTFTQAIPLSFRGYQTIREDENANWVQLTQTIGMHGGSAPLMLEFGHPSIDKTADLIIPGSEGQVVSSGKPIVICWVHTYSVLVYLGRWLSVIRSEQHETSQCADSPESIAAEIIGLLTAILSTVSSYGNIEIAKEILEDFSAAVTGEDLLSLVADIFEQQLQTMKYRASFERSLDLLVACVEFFRATTKILPGRIWPVLGRTSLIGINGSSGLLSSVVLSVEVSSMDFTFLESCIGLYDTLIEVALSCSLSQTSSLPTSNSSQTLLQSATADTSHTPTRIRGEMLLSYTQIIFEFYETICSWNFRQRQQRARILADLASCFKKVIYYWFGIDDTHEFKIKLTAALALSASFLVQSLTFSSNPDGLLNPILKGIADGLDRLDPCASVVATNTWRREIHALIELSIEVLKAKSLSKQAPIAASHQLLNTSPILIRLFASDYLSRPIVLKLLQRLMAEEEMRSGSEAQSLLGQLGPKSSYDLIELIGYLDQPLDNKTLLLDIWNLLHSLVTKRQQWFAVAMLTGTVSQPPNSGTSTDSSKQLRGKSLLARALDYLAEDPGSTDMAVVPSVLSFVQRALENWPWATLSVWSHDGFIRFITEYHRKLTQKRTSNPINDCYEAHTTATIANVLTSYLHHIRTTQDRTAFSKLRGAIEYYAECGKSRLGYNDSLHANLKDNVKRIFPRCEISKFKKTASASFEYGEDFYYDVTFATKVLGFSRAWKGTRGQGLESEFRRANINLSLVDAQLCLWKSWKSLAVEHSPYFAIDGEVRKFMARAVKKCLDSNAQDFPADSVFDSLLQSRIELAIALLQRLVAAKTRALDFVHLLEPAWTALTSRTTSYDAAIANGDLPYFRSLLNTVFLTIQFHIRVAPTRSERHERTKNILLDLLANVVAKGLKALVTSLHSQADSTDADSKIGVTDFRLLLALLQVIIRVPDLHVSGSSQASEALLLSPLSESALHLYSWSHKLLGPASDPVYAPISGSFLATLSSLPLLAEDLAASQNVLSTLASAKMTRLLMTRTKGAGPLESDLLPLRLYETWTRGILPLCLNLLQAVGRAVSADVLHFLNLIPHQLERASLALNAQGESRNFSLSSIKEVQDLALIAAVLDKYREAGQSAGVDPLNILEDLKWWNKSDRKGIRDDVDDLLASTPKMRLRLVPGDEREAALAQKKPKGDDVGGKDACVNALEELVVEELRKCAVCLKAETEE